MRNAYGPQNRYIAMSTRLREFKADPHFFYRHLIYWKALDGCPPGFLVQKVERDLKWQTGSISVGGRWTWSSKASIKVAYWELWEVVEGYDGGKVMGACVYPAVLGQADSYATSRGVVTGDALLKDTNKRPPETGAHYNYDDVYAHDIFEESRPKFAVTQGGKKVIGYLPVKGTFKIKGSVFFLPSADATAKTWTDAFLDHPTTQRGKKYTFIVIHTYTGGPLWMRDSTGVSTPHDRYRVVTRYEAGEFLNVKEADIMHSSDGGQSLKTAIGADSYGDVSREREYPHQP
jgi:hypothetical protein